MKMDHGNNPVGNPSLSLEGLNRTPPDRLKDALVAALRECRPDVQRQVLKMIADRGVEEPTGDPRVELLRADLHRLNPLTRLDEVMRSADIPRLDRPHSSLTPRQRIEVVVAWASQDPARLDRLMAAAKRHLE